MKFNVIIIDDSPLQLSISSHIVQNNENLNLIGSYSNPLLGLNAVNNSEVDIVLLDVEMPQIDGFSLLKLFTNEVEVIINSTKSSYEAMAFYHGAIDFINKPIKESKLNISLNKIIRSKNQMLTKENNLRVFVS